MMKKLLFLSIIISVSCSPKTTYHGKVYYDGNGITKVKGYNRKVDTTGNARLADSMQDMIKRLDIDGYIKLTDSVLKSKN